MSNTLSLQPENRDVRTKWTASVWAIVWCFASLPAARAVEVGEAAGPVKLLNSAGIEVALDYKQRPATALLFLSSRCPATEKAITDINALYQRYRYKQVLFVGICSNNVETAEELRDFAQQRGMIFSIFRDPKGEVAKRLGVKSTPEVALIDNDGKFVYRGGLETSDGRQILAGALERLIAAKPAKTEVETPSERTPIGKPGDKIEHENTFGSIAFSSELIFERIPGASAFHCSTIAEAPNGDLLCVWYGGSYESADDQVIFLSRRKPGERIWSEPEVLISDSLQPPGNGLIFTDGKGRVWLVWCRMESKQPVQRGEGWDRCRLMFRTSSDNGQTWTRDLPMLADDELVKKQGMWFVPRNPPIRTKNGATVLGLEAIRGDEAGSVFLISRDDGDHWKRGGFTTAGSQPALAERRDGSILSTLRIAPKIVEITSTDDGETWSPGKPTKLDNPDAGISMCRLQDGHFVLVFNDSPLFRTPLNIARSLDDGATWETPMALESNPGEYSYPCVIQTSDGKIHITYTYRRYSIKHVELNEDWLVHTRRPN